MSESGKRIGLNEHSVKLESNRKRHIKRSEISLACQGKLGMDRKSDKAFRDRDVSGKKESLSKSVDHTLVGDRGRDTPDYLESIQVLKE